MQSPKPWCYLPCCTEMESKGRTQTQWVGARGRYGFRNAEALLTAWGLQPRNFPSRKYLWVILISPCPGLFCSDLQLPWNKWPVTKNWIIPPLPAGEAPRRSWSRQKKTLQFSTGLVSNFLVYPQVSKYFIDVLLLSTQNIPDFSDAHCSFTVSCSRLWRRRKRLVAQVQTCSWRSTCSQWQDVTWMEEKTWAQLLLAPGTVLVCEKSSGPAFLLLS